MMTEETVSATIQSKISASHTATLAGKHCQSDGLILDSLPRKPLLAINSNLRCKLLLCSARRFAWCALRANVQNPQMNCGFCDLIGDKFNCY